MSGKAGQINGPRVAEDEVPTAVRSAGLASLNEAEAVVLETDDSFSIVPWSSHHAYISAAKKWAWLSKEFLLGMFADTKAKAKKGYLEFVQKEDSSEVTDFFSKKNLASVFGTQDFIDWMKEKFYSSIKHYEIPQSRQLAPTIAAIKEAVCRSYGIEVHMLEHAKRGQVNEPRNVAIYLARKCSGLALGEIGKEFGLEKYSSVSSIVTRTENQLSKNKRLQNRLEKYGEKQTRVKQRPLFTWRDHSGLAQKKSNLTHGITLVILKT